MNNPVIVRVVKYIPRGGGNVVYEAFEEVEVSPGKWLPLDPRNPTPEEVESADDKAIAQQQATITTSFPPFDLGVLWSSSAVFGVSFSPVNAHR